jgi:4-alpha-glucanotransferase
MKFPPLDHYYTGIAVPVSSLRSELSLGCGEFADLPLLGRWCRDVGIEIIQILPVNDTGFQSSPYSANSAFALNPIYIRLEDLPETGALPGRERFFDEAEELRGSFDADKRINYQKVMEAKLDLLKKIFLERAEAIAGDPALTQWIGRNEWIKDYAVYRTLKIEQRSSSWTEWDRMRELGESDIMDFWDEDYASSRAYPSVLFFAWIQFRLEEQLKNAAVELMEMKVHLKGDLPILMNLDSADVWAYRRNFRLDLNAGAPPDMFSELGQNWGFPCYDWEHLEEADYRWWKNRLTEADKFYHAYRIDHVLGFFRIWANPARNASGMLGFFLPQAAIEKRELEDAGFSEERIFWLCEPHIGGGEIRAACGGAAEEVISSCFRQLGEEDLYLFKDGIKGEKDLEECRPGGKTLEPETREALLSFYRDRALLEPEPGRFAAAWHFRSSRSYRALSDDEKIALQALLDRSADASEALWEENGRRLLSFMNSTAAMLTCAEDLGVIPDCVPRTLEDLGILGLRIPRWSRRYKEQDEPFIDPADYPFLTVCAPSVHDTSTMRGWWSEGDEKERFWSDLGFPGPCPPEYDSDTAGRVMARLLETSSVFCIFQLQDLFDADDGLRSAEASEDRVNVPGSSNEWNWGYRIPCSLEELRERKEFNRLLQEKIMERRNRETEEA